MFIPSIVIALLSQTWFWGEFIEKLWMSKNVHPISSDKLNWKHCSKNKKEGVSYPRRIWNHIWKQCTKLRSNTRWTSWIVKYVHSYHSDSLFVAKPDLGENLTKKLSEVDVSAIVSIGRIININLTLTYTAVWTRIEMSRDSFVKTSWTFFWPNNSSN